MSHDLWVINYDSWKGVETHFSIIIAAGDGEIIIGISLNRFSRCYARAITTLSLWPKYFWHLWRPLYIDFEFTNTKFSIWRGRQRCQQYKGYSSYVIYSSLVQRWSAPKTVLMKRRLTVIKFLKFLSFFEFLWKWFQIGGFKRFIQSFEISSMHQNFNSQSVLTVNPISKIMIIINSLSKNRIFNMNYSLGIHFYNVFGYRIVDDKWMLVTLSWWQFWDRIPILVTSFGCWCPTLMLEDVRDKNGQNRDQYLKVVANIFCLQYPSPTSPGFL